MINGEKLGDGSNDEPKVTGFEKNFMYIKNALAGTYPQDVSYIRY